MIRRSSFCSSRRCPIAVLLLVHSAPLGSTGHCVRFGSAVRFYTPRGTAVRFYTPRGTVPFDSPCAHSYSLCWLRLAATLFTHTLSHAWCPVTLLSLTCCSTVVVTVAAASCGRARDSIRSIGSIGSIGAVARCVVAARLPPSVISVTVQQCSAVHRRIQKMVSAS